MSYLTVSVPVIVNLLEQWYYTKAMTEMEVIGIK